MYSYLIGRRGITDPERDVGLRLGAALASARSSQGLSGGQLAAASGVSLDALRSIESGRVASPGFALVAALGRSLGLSLDALARQSGAWDARP